MITRYMYAQLPRFHEVEPYDIRFLENEIPLDNYVDLQLGLLDYNLLQAIYNGNYLIICK